MNKPAIANTATPQLAPLRAAALLLLVALIGVSLGQTFLTQSQRQYQQAEPVLVSIESEYFQLLPQQIEPIQQLSQQYFQQASEEAALALKSRLEPQLDVLFAEAKERLPAFADWYYSLSGEYSRIAMMALHRTGMAEGGYLTRQIHDHLFPEQQWDAHITSMETELSELLGDVEQQTRDGWLALMMSQLSGNRVPAPLPDINNHQRNTIRLDSTELFARQQADLQQRIQISHTMAGSTLAAAASWHLARMAGSRAAAGRIAARGTARAGTAALSATAICAPGGPLALGCGLAAGATAWIATDRLLLGIDEAMNRQQMLDALSASLNTMRQDIEATLSEDYNAAITARHAAINATIHTTFSPLNTDTTL